MNLQQRKSHKTVTLRFLHGVDSLHLRVTACQRGRLTCQLTGSARCLKSKGSCLETRLARAHLIYDQRLNQLYSAGGSGDPRAAKGDGEKDEIGDTATERPW